MILTRPCMMKLSWISVVHIHWLKHLVLELGSVLHQWHSWGMLLPSSGVGTPGHLVGQWLGSCKWNWDVSIHGNLASFVDLVGNQLLSYPWYLGRCDPWLPCSIAPHNHDILVVPLQLWENLLVRPSSVHVPYLYPQILPAYVPGVHDVSYVTARLCMS